MKSKLSFLFSALIFSTLLILASCTKDNVDSVVRSYTPDEYKVLSNSLNLPEGTFEYKNPELPDHMRSGGLSASTVSNHGATLGRVLFYDARLSANDTKSCASCHDQQLGFAEDRALSEGFDGGETRRNSLALGNVRFYYQDRGFFWDERAVSVEDQVRQTVTNHIEMGMDLTILPEKLEGEDYYDILFQKAFGSSEVTFDRIANALSQFVRSVISSNSAFDRAMVADGITWNIDPDFTQFTAKENQGKHIYNENCSTCHGNVVFLGVAADNNGLDMEYADNGIGELTGNSFRNGHFKVPFLRNIALTGPYMHDGRFETLEEVIEHYSSGIKDHPNLSNRLKASDGSPKHLNLSQDDKDALIAFLHTLTDEDFMTNEAFTDPFK